MLSNLFLIHQRLFSPKQPDFILIHLSKNCLLQDPSFRRFYGQGFSARWISGKPSTLLLQKRPESPLFDRFTSLTHEALVKRQIVNRKQRRPKHLVGLEQMANISPAVPTSDTRTILFDWPGILRMALIPHPQWPIGSEC
jgi:hypothetical protein